MSDEQHLLFERADERCFTHEVWRAVAEFAKTGKRFGADDVRRVIRKRGVIEPPDMRALGPIMKAAETAELIRAVGIQKTVAPQRNGGYETVWSGGPDDA